MSDHIYKLELRRRKLVRDSAGCSQWQIAETPTTWRADETALLLCDVWDRHWCRGALERQELLIAPMNRVAAFMRDHGSLIVHAPSDTMDFYADHSARLRGMGAPRVGPPEETPHDEPPKPIDDSDGGSDTDNDPGEPGEEPWTRQHPDIVIDGERDVISDDGVELLGVYAERGIRHVAIAGVHTNFCVQHRSFAIRQMVRWGSDIVLVRDLTDAMYNPAKAPYVSHATGTQLEINYIEKFWCPSVGSMAFQGLR